jgi:hypothetical protein
MMEDLENKIYLCIDAEIRCQQRDRKDGNESTAAIHAAHIRAFEVVLRIMDGKIRDSELSLPMACGGHEQ